MEEGSGDVLKMFSWLLVDFFGEESLDVVLFDCIFYCFLFVGKMVDILVFIVVVVLEDIQVMLVGGFLVIIY